MKGFLPIKLFSTSNTRDVAECPESGGRETPEQLSPTGEVAWGNLLPITERERERERVPLKLAGSYMNQLKSK